MAPGLRVRRVDTIRIVVLADKDQTLLAKEVEIRNGRHVSVSGHHVRRDSPTVARATGGAVATYRCPSGTRCIWRKTGNVGPHHQLVPLAAGSLEIQPKSAAILGRAWDDRCKSHLLIVAVPALAVDLKNLTPASCGRSRNSFGLFLITACETCRQRCRLLQMPSWVERSSAPTARGSEVVAETTFQRDCDPP